MRYEASRPHHRRDPPSHKQTRRIGSAQDAKIQQMAARNGRVIVDLVRLPEASSLRGTAEYIGIAW